MTTPAAPTTATATGMASKVISWVNPLTASGRQNIINTTFAVAAVGIAGYAWAVDPVSAGKLVTNIASTSLEGIATGVKTAAAKLSATDWSSLATAAPGAAPV